MEKKHFLAHVCSRILSYIDICKPAMYNLYLPSSKGEGYDRLQKSAEYIQYLMLGISHSNIQQCQFQCLLKFDNEITVLNRIHV